MSKAQRLPNAETHMKTKWFEQGRDERSQCFLQIHFLVKKKLYSIKYVCKNNNIFSWEHTEGSGVIASVRLTYMCDPQCHYVVMDRHKKVACLTAHCLAFSTIITRNSIIFT